MKTLELTGDVLNYWVSQVDGHEHRYSYCADWSFCGPLIDKFNISVDYDASGKFKNAWAAAAPFCPMARAGSPLVAICRAIVYWKYGDEVPDNIAIQK